MDKEGEKGRIRREKQDGLEGRNRMNQKEETGWIRREKQDRDRGKQDG